MTIEKPLFHPNEEGFCGTKLEEEVKTDGDMAAVLRDVKTDYLLILFPILLDIGDDLAFILIPVLSLYCLIVAIVQASLYDF